MRNTLFKGSSPKEELELAKTNLALGQPVDIGAVLEALELTLGWQEEAEYWRGCAKDLENERNDLEKIVDELEDELAGFEAMDLDDE